jgi:hypothetical protein
MSPGTLGHTPVAGDRAPAYTAHAGQPGQSYGLSLLMQASRDGAQAYTIRRPAGKYTAPPLSHAFATLSPWTRSFCMLRYRSVLAPGVHGAFRMFER